MELTFECQACGRVGRCPAVESSREATCASCGTVRGVRASAFDASGLHSCPICATDDLYIQKDFPQGLGLTIVVVGFVVSTVFWYLDRPVPALGVLLISALVDMALFYLVPDVTICYRCLSQYRGDGSNPDARFQPFDLALGERYRQERLRVRELKERGASAPASASTSTAEPSPPSSPSD